MKVFNWFKSQQWLNNVIKWVIAVFLFYTLYQQLFQHEQSSRFSDLIIATNWNEHILQLTFLIILSVLNWTLEIVKWYHLVNKLEDTSWYQAVLATLGGVTLGLLTPNRIGDFAGKILFIERANKIRGALLSLVGSFSMTFANILVGVFACWYYQAELTFFEPVLGWSLFVIVLSIFILFAWCYFNIYIMAKYLFSIKGMRKFRSYISTAHVVSNTDLILYFIISLFRYSFIITQFLILLSIFDVELVWWQGVLGVSMIYLIQTILPTPAMIELGIRGHASIAFISAIAIGSVINVLATTYTIWIINVSVPAIMGGIILMKVDYKSILNK